MFESDPIIEHIAEYLRNSRVDICFIVSFLFFIVFDILIVSLFIVFSIFCFLFHCICVLRSDRCMIEYDLENSSITNGLLTRGGPTVIELDSDPTACMWYPRGPNDREDLFVTANSDFKFRCWNWNANATNKTCRKTILGPTYGGPLRQLVRTKSQITMHSTLL